MPEAKLSATIDLLPATPRPPPTRSREDLKRPRQLRHRRPLCPAQVQLRAHSSECGSYRRPSGRCGHNAAYRWLFIALIQARRTADTPVCPRRLPKRSIPATRGSSFRRNRDHGIALRRISALGVAHRQHVVSPPHWPDHELAFRGNIADAGRDGSSLAFHRTP